MIIELVIEDVKFIKVKMYFGLWVLIVEDNCMNIMILEVFMCNKGFECYSVMDGV